MKFFITMVLALGVLAAANKALAEVGCDKLADGKTKPIDCSALKDGSADKIACLAKKKADKTKVVPE